VLLAQLKLTAMLITGDAIHFIAYDSTIVPRPAIEQAICGMDARLLAPARSRLLCFSTLRRCYTVSYSAV